MQTCFETGNEKLYMQIKNKIIYCSDKFATRTPISAKQALVVTDLAVPVLNMILIKCLVKSVSHEKNKVKQKKAKKTTTEFATTKEKFYENCKIVKFTKKKDSVTD